MIPPPLLPIANHLWQSTLFAGIAGLIALTLRKNSARVRHWVWVAGGMGLIRGAYASDPFTPIIGGPSWIHSAFYEINAKAEGNPSVATMRGPMMQVLLEEHFHLKIHHERREGPVYFLTVARGGLKLNPVK